jgi:hypothetical protein
MTTSMLLAPTVAGLGLLCLPAPAVMRARAPSDRWRGGTLTAEQRRALVVGAGAAAVVVLFGRWPWWSILLFGGLGGALTLRLPLRRTAAERAVARHRLAVHADLLAACLDAGMSVGAALTAVAAPGISLQRNGFDDPDDPLALLDAVSALLLLGSDPARAWQGARQHPDLASLAAAAGRSASGGARFADAVREHAVVLRAASADAAERSAGRAGVAITAPLGLCFLPAFLCLGLAPVVVGLLSSLDLF